MADSNSCMILSSLYVGFFLGRPLFVFIFRVNPIVNYKGSPLVLPFFRALLLLVLHFLLVFLQLFLVFPSIPPGYQEEPLFLLRP